MIGTSSSQAAQRRPRRGPAPVGHTGGVGECFTVKDDLLRRILRIPARAGRLIYKSYLMITMAIRNAFSRERCTGDTPVVVSMTSYGRRAFSVYQTIESIARGSSRPARFILWIDEPDFYAAPPKQLQRLRRRGLEIRRCENYGPHKKYYPHVISEEHYTFPLVTADDDVFYARSWLSEIVQAHVAHPDDVISFRTKRVEFRGEQFSPYLDWPLSTTSNSSFANFSTGTSGALYPPRVLIALRERGEAFREHCAAVDDVWLHATAVATGARTRQVRDRAIHFPMRLGTQHFALFWRNHQTDGNDRALELTYDTALRSRIKRDIVSGG